MLNIAIDNALVVFEIAYHADLSTTSAPHDIGDLLQNNAGGNDGEHKRNKMIHELIIHLSWGG